LNQRWHWNRHSLAAHYHKLLADQGSGDASYNDGDLLGNGEDVPIDGFLRPTLGPSLIRASVERIEEETGVEMNATNNISNQHERAALVRRGANEMFRQNDPRLVSLPIGG
jgi:hypothetical protein